MTGNGRFRHHRVLKMIAAIGVIVALFVPSLAERLGQYESGSLYWFRASAVLVVTALFVFFVFKLIRFLFNRDAVTKEDRLRTEQEERCAVLRGQALAACRGASGDAGGYKKRWKKPEDSAVQQAIWEIQPIENPEFLEVLLNAWKAGDRDTELALQLMYSSWDRWEQDYDCNTRSYGGLDGQVLIMGFQEPYEYLGGHQSENHTLLLTAGHMISLFDYRTGLTLNDAEMCLKRFLKSCPEGIPDAEFEGRGAFGDYFTHIIGHRRH